MLWCIHNACRPMMPTDVVGACASLCLLTSRRAGAELRASISLGSRTNPWIEYCSVGTIWLSWAHRASMDNTHSIGSS